MASIKVYFLDESGNPIGHNKIQLDSVYFTSRLAWTDGQPGYFALFDNVDYRYPCTVYARDVSSVNPISEIVSISFTSPTQVIEVTLHKIPPPTQYTITVNTSPSGLDSPQGGGTYDQGATITIGVGNVSGYTFNRWQRDGADYVTQQSFSYQVDAAHTFTAIFVATGDGGDGGGDGGGGGVAVNPWPFIIMGTGTTLGVIAVLYGRK